MPETKKKKKNRINLEQTRCPTTDEQLTTNKYYSAIKKSDFTYFIPTWTDLEEVKLSKISHKVREEYEMIPPMTMY